MTLTDDATGFLRAHHTGVLSSIDRTGNVTGAVVYYFVDSKNSIYVLTKSGTHKAHNILSHSQVALTLYSAKRRQTLQLQGIAEIDTNQDIKNFVFYELTQPRSYEDGQDLPPVTKLKEGGFMVIRIRPTTVTFHNYGGNN